MTIENLLMIFLTLIILQLCQAFIFDDNIKNHLIIELFGISEQLKGVKNVQL